MAEPPVGDDDMEAFTVSANPAAVPVAGAGQRAADFAVLDRCLRGEVRAFDELVLRYQGELYGLSYRMLLNAEEARDAVQDAFINAYRALRAFRRQASVRTWLFRITTNQCLDRLRLRQREQAQELPEMPVADHGQRVVDQAQVRAALAELPAAYRAVVLLRHFHGLSYREIAAMLHVPVGTVKTHLHRARAQLKDRLVE